MKDLSLVMNISEFGVTKDMIEGIAVRKECGDTTGIICLTAL